jgi:hypothetical protein
MRERTFRVVCPVTVKRIKITRLIEKVKSRSRREVIFCHLANWFKWQCAYKLHFTNTRHANETPRQISPFRQIW